MSLAALPDVKRKSSTPASTNNGSTVRLFDSVESLPAFSILPGPLLFEVRMMLLLTRVPEASPPMRMPPFNTTVFVVHQRRAWRRILDADPINNRPTRTTRLS